MVDGNFALGLDYKALAFGLDITYVRLLLTPTDVTLPPARPE